MRQIFQIGLCWLALVNVTAAAPAATVTGSVLLWQEQEPGIEPYPNRMLITTDHLRSDDGEDDSDYLLFERRTGVLYSVSHERRALLVVTAEPLPAAAGPRPEVQVDIATDPDAPLIGGQAVQAIRLHSGDALCMQAMVVPGLLPEAVAALREMRARLAGRQYRDLYKTPEEFRTPCFLANYVYEMDRALQTGLPIRESVSGGVRRALRDYRTGQTLPAALFELPADYRREEIP
ncbi:MAG: hypothetical protein WCY26_06495 [Thiohalobacteraceae bacterium]|nr:hypothetical protein [Gammaproteobacteria bacterium]